MPKLLDADGEEAVAGTTEGYWLCAADFVSTAGKPVLEFGKLGFPRDFPNVYSTSKVLKSLIGKKGSCAGKMVSVVAAPSPEAVSNISDIKFQPLQSFANAEIVQQATGWPVLQGWIVWEQLELPLSEAFVVERYWWNQMPDSKWVDFTPRPDGCSQLLLAEAAAGAPKGRSALTEADKDVFVHLLKLRFPAIAAQRVQEDLGPSGPETGSSPQRPAAPAEPRPAAPSDAEIPPSIQSLVQRICNSEAGAVQELEQKLRGDEELCVQVTLSPGGVVTALVKMLADTARREEALNLLVVISDGAVGLRRRDSGDAIIAAGVVEPLVRLLEDGSAGVQESAAAVLGNISHESPTNQDAVAAVAPVFERLVRLLDATDAGPAQEAAYAIWNLTVAHEENSREFVKRGAVPKLAKLLHHYSDVAQENAAGALMHITACEEARVAIKDAGAIPRLCELLKPHNEPEVSSQAAGALLNMAIDSSEYAGLIVKEGAIAPLINLVKGGPELARDYGAGALMNLMRSDVAIAEEASKGGAIAVHVDLLSMSDSRLQAQALGALANLARDSATRQVEIYKHQVTRKCVKLLADADVEMRRGSVSLIMNLATHAKIKDRIVEAGALKPLAKLLEDADEEVKEYAAGALANIFSDNAPSVTKGFEEAPQMVSALVAITSSRSVGEDAKRQAAFALAMLAAEDVPCQKAWEAGAKRPLLELLEANVEQAALGIMNLSWKCPDKKEELAKDGAVEHLLKMLEAGDDVAKGYAAGALMNMTAGAPQSADLCGGAVPRLVAMLRGPPTQAAEWAAGALANVALGSGGAQERASAAGAAPALAALLAKATPAGRPLVVQALAAIAEGHAAVVRRVLGSSEKAKLKEFKASGDQELLDSVQTLVGKLGDDFTV